MKSLPSSQKCGDRDVKCIDKNIILTYIFSIGFYCGAPTEESEVLGIA